MAVDVEKIVREVLDRIVSGSIGPSRAAEPAAKPSDGGSELSLEEKIVTLEKLKGKLTGIRQLSLSRGAIVTPAARDFLREKKVQLSWRESCHCGGSSGKASVAVVLGLAETNFEPVHLIHAIQKTGANVVRLANSGFASVVNELCDEVARNGRVGVLLTGLTTAAVCIANRCCGVRAASGEGRANITAAVNSVGANLLVLDPQQRGEWEVKLAVGDFVRGGHRRCPDHLKTFLT